MEFNPPFGYKKIVPLQRDMRVRAPGGSLPEFASQSNSLPIAAAEVMAASLDYPVAFVASSEFGYSPVVILGTGPGENLFATRQAWAPGFYVPAYVRRHPFCMGNIPAAAGAPAQEIICIEEEFTDSKGVPNFDDQGNPTEAFAQIRNFLGQFQVELQRSRELCKLLADYKLFEPMLATFRIFDKQFELSGLHRIAQPRLEQLTSNQLKALVKKGGMALIYQHIASMLRFERITERKMLAINGGQSGNGLIPAEASGTSALPAELNS